MPEEQPDEQPQPISAEPPQAGASSKKPLIFIIAGVALFSMCLLCSGGGFILYINSNKVNVLEIAEDTFTYTDDDDELVFTIDGDKNSVEVGYACVEDSTCETLAFVQYDTFFDRMGCNQSVSTKFDNMRPLDGTIDVECDKADISFSMSRDSLGSDYYDYDYIDVTLTADKK